MQTHGHKLAAHHSAATHVTHLLSIHSIATHVTHLLSIHSIATHHTLAVHCNTCHTLACTHSIATRVTHFPPSLSLHSPNSDFLHVLHLLGSLQHHLDLFDLCWSEACLLLVMTTMTREGRPTSLDPGREGGRGRGRGREREGERERERERL